MQRQTLQILIWGLSWLCTNTPMAVYRCTENITFTDRFSQRICPRFRWVTIATKCFSLNILDVQTTIWIITPSVQALYFKQRNLSGEKWQLKRSLKAARPFHRYFTLKHDYFTSRQGQDFCPLKKCIARGELPGEPTPLALFESLQNFIQVLRILRDVDR